MMARSPDHDDAVSKPTQPSNTEPKNQNITGRTHAHSTHFADDLEVRHLRQSRAVGNFQQDTKSLLSAREQVACRTRKSRLRVLYWCECRPLSFLTAEKSRRPMAAKPLLGAERLRCFSSHAR